MSTQAGDNPLNHPILLCVDDERNVLFTLRAQLLRHFPDHRVEVVESAEEALELLDDLFARGITVPLAIVDQIMPGMQGDQLLIELHTRYPQIVQIMLTGQASAENVGNVVNRGNLYRFMTKPWDETDLTLTVTEALRRYQQDRQLAQKQAQLEQANRDLAALNASLEQQVQERTQQLQKSEANLKKAQELAHLGHWEYDFATEQVYWSDEVYRIHGLDPAQPPCRGEESIQYIHPDDHTKYQQEIVEMVARGKGFVTDLRLSDRNGTLRFTETRGEPLFNSDHTLTGYRGTVQDITERKQAEIALKASETRFMELSEACPANIYIIVRRSDGSFYFEHISRAIETIHEIPLEQFLVNANLIRECIHPDDLAGYDASVQLSLETLQPFSHEWRIITPSGTIKWLQGSSCPKQRDNGDIAWYGAAIDITDRKRAEAALKESEERWSLAIEGSNDGIWDQNLRNGELFLSHRCMEMLGYAYDQINTYQKWLRYVHPDDQLLLQATCQDYLNRKTPIFTCEYRVRCQDGTDKWLLVRGKAIWDETGLPVRVVGSITDTTIRRQAELALYQLNAELEQRVAQRTQELARSEQDLRTIFNNVYDAILIHAVDGTVLNVNERALELHHATREQLLNASIADLSAPGVPLEVIPINIQRVQAGETLRLEWKHRRFDDQSTFDVELSLRSVILGDRPVFIAGIRDISDRKQYEAQLQRTNEELLHATRLKDEFLATMSHELRTPLNAILGTTESLQAAVFGPISPAQQKALEMIDQSGYHLLALINDILDVAKIEAGEITLECQATAIAPLCKSSLALIQPQARKKEIQLDFHLAPAIPAIWVDERRIRQVLLNLLSNAVKFTPAGGQITLTAHYDLPAPDDSETDDAVWALYLSVKDTGIGIAPDQQHRIFQPFVQLDSALNRHYEGTGLGLTLVKQIVELHGGKVQLISEVGVGSCFTVVLPVWINPTQTSEPTTTPRLDPDLPTVGADFDPLVLLAEDNEANRQTLALYLNAKGYRVLLAKDGQEAIALAQSAHPAIIVMDIQMPGMDGLEAIERIRAEQDSKAVPIIALTALAMPSDRDRCLAAGANEYLSKPVKLKQLDSTIQYLLASKLD